MLQRLSRRDENFGSRLAFAIFDLLATRISYLENESIRIQMNMTTPARRLGGSFLLVPLERHSQQGQQFPGLFISRT